MQNRTLPIAAWPVRGVVLLLLSAASAAQADDSALTYATHGDPLLAGLIDESLQRNPRLRQARMNFQAARHRVPQVTALPDPTLGVTWHARRPETRTGPQTKSLSISQKFPWPGKLSARGRMAAARAEAQNELVRADRGEVVRQVKLAYFDLGYLDRAIAIADEEEQLLRHYESLAQALYAQGIGPQQAAVRLQAEITRVLNRRHGLVRQRLELKAGLNSLRDRPTGTPIRPTGTPIGAVMLGERPVTGIDGERLQAIGRDRRAEVKAARLLVASDEQGVRLAHRQYWPDIVVGASWGTVAGRRDAAGRALPPPDNGKDVYSLTLGVSVPLFRAKYDAAVEESAARLEGARAFHRDTVNDVNLAVRAAQLRLGMVNEQLALFEAALLPQAEQALGLIETAYSTGSAEIVDLLDSEQVLFEVRLGLARLQSDYMKALAEMEWAIGSPFPEEQS